MVDESDQAGEQRYLTCAKASPYEGRLTTGRAYLVVATRPETRQVRVRDDRDRLRWYPNSCFFPPDPVPFDLWLEFELWDNDPNFDPTDDASNMIITLPSGERYAINVWTFKHFDRIRQEPPAELFGGRYLMPPDLFIDRLERPLLEDLIGYLIWSGHMPDAWRSRLDDTEE